MNTNRHDETNHGSVTPAGLSHPDIEDGKWAETLLAGENRYSRCSPPDVRSQKFLMPCADSSKISRADLSWNRAG